MASKDLWKYCTAAQTREMLVSMRLLDGVAFEEKDYSKYLYSVSNHTEQHYHSVSIPKKNGGDRKLQIPDRLLRTIQKNILKNILYGLSVSGYASAYQKGVSPADNAAVHVGAQQILKLDIVDFFGSISFPLVYQNAFPAEYFPAAVRMLLTSLCCYKECLPQGAPTSPAISNLVMKPFDSYMGEWCKERGISYTRYCDDMTFSGMYDASEIKNKVRGFLRVLGMELNEKKTQILRPGQRQVVTGIVVNEKLQVSREYRRKLRAEIYYCKKYGVKGHLAHCKGEKTEEKTGCESYLQRMLGKVNYVLMVNPEDKEFRHAEESLKELIRQQKDISSEKDTNLKNE